MKINFTHLLLTLLTGSFASAQSYEWGGKFGGNGEDVVLAMHTDAAGNTYTTGYFTDTADFDIGDNTFNLETGSMFDCFVQKTDANGNFVWAKQIGGEASDNGTKITTDAEGNVYVTGVFQETADFDPGSTEYLMTSAGSLDIFIVKLTPAGDFVWAKQFAGMEYEESNGIGTDSSGNVYISGYFYSSVDFNPGASDFSMEPAGFGDGFAVKLSPGGEFVWAKKFGGIDFDLATGLKVMPSGDVYISGNFTGPSDFNPADNATFELTTDENYSGIFLLHLKADGEFIKAVRVGHVVGEAYGFSVDVDSAGAAYVTGYFGGEATFTTTAGNVIMTPTEFYNSYIAKVNANGTIAWAREMGSDQLTLSYGLAVNTLNEVLVSGYFNGTMVLDAITLTENNAGDSMSYVAKLDGNGNFIWAQKLGGINFVDRCAISVDANNNTYISSAFEGTVDINPHPGMTDEVTVTDFRDNFLVKLNTQALSTENYDIATTRVFPNPGKDVIIIAASHTVAGEKYVVYDMAGRQVAEGVINSADQLNIEMLQHGIYTIIVKGDTFRVIKE